MEKQNQPIVLTKEDGDSSTNRYGSDTATEDDYSGDLATSSLRFGKVPYKEKLWTFKCVLHVSQHPDFQSCKNYYGQLLFERAAEEGLQVGHCEGKIVDKEVRDAHGNELWIAELLDCKQFPRSFLATHADENEEVSELERYLQMFFLEEGEIRDDPALSPARRLRLAGRKLLAISEFMIDKEYRRPGLAQKALRTFLLAVTEAPKDYAFEGYMLLSPASFAYIYTDYETAKIAAGRAPRTRVQIEDALIEKYKLSGLELVFLGDRKWDGDGITIMDRDFTAAKLRAELNAILAAEAADGLKSGPVTKSKRQKQIFSQVESKEDQVADSVPKTPRRAPVILRLSTNGSRSRHHVPQLANPRSHQDFTNGSTTRPETMRPSSQVRGIIAGLSLGGGHSHRAAPGTYEEEAFSDFYFNAMENVPPPDRFRGSNNTTRSPSSRSGAGAKVIGGKRVSSQSAAPLMVQSLRKSRQSAPLDLESNGLEVVDGSGFAAAHERR